MYRSMGLRSASVAAGALCLSWALSAQAAQPFELVAKGLHDNASLSRANAASAKDATGAMCGGENVSPELSFNNAPAGTKSFSVTVYDPDGATGLGIVHWVVYGIPASTRTLARGVGAKGPEGSTPGTNRTNGPGYYGPCPPMGDKPHHYIFQAYALDLEPGALKQGLKRDELIEEMRGHVLGYSSVMLRYGRPAKPARMK
ncbi:Phosphatidylethanolamine-binding protein [Bordetella sputigena]|uniref:YbhB/YbcL family Raf kinase inhibitor-like protein n=1 Tax=Bordetella sputigena TaxID=1416810 RepID=UPI0039EEEED5